MAYDLLKQLEMITSGAAFGMGRDWQNMRIHEAIAEIERLRAKAEWADEASEMMYNFATGKDDGAAIIAHVKAKLELV